MLWESPHLGNSGPVLRSETHRVLPGAAHLEILIRLSKLFKQQIITLFGDRVDIGPLLLCCRAAVWLEPQSHDVMTVVICDERQRQFLSLEKCLWVFNAIRHAPSPFIGHARSFIIGQSKRTRRFSRFLMRFNDYFLERDEVVEFIDVWQGIKL